MTISYAITVNDEIKEFSELFNLLYKYKQENDEIVVIQDNNAPDEIKKSVLQIVYDKENVIYNLFKFEKNFADLKNYMISKCSKDYIFQLDADELPTEYLLKNLKNILQQNKSYDMFWLGRINTVKDIPLEYVKQMQWVINSDGYINFPDPQQRIWKNQPQIKYKGKVHENLEGYKTYSKFPFTKEFCLIHNKTFEKQVKQNNLYSTIQ